MIAAGFLLSRYLVSAATEQAERDLAEEAEVVGSRVATQLAPSDLEGPLTGERYEQFKSYLAGSALPADTRRIKLWNREGVVIFSDNPEIMGNVYPIEGELEEALEGETASELSGLERAENVGERKFERLLEVYTPLRFPDSSEVWGAFEVYQDYSGVEALGARMREAVNIGVGAMIGFVYLCTVGLVKRGSDTIRKRQDELLGEIAERKRAEDQIKHQAYHDSLTGLPNRVLLKDRLSQALAQARRKEQLVGVMFLDLDRFKLVNDTIGHTMGDKLLQAVAERLSGVVREADTVGRPGGDEFTLVLPEVSGVEQVSGVAERIFQALRRPFGVAGQELYVTVSIGIVMYPVDGEDAETLLSNADIAMYGAKEEGRDCFQMFTPAMNAYISKRMTLEKELRQALERKQFIVHYQPQVNIETGQIVGIEALVRWQHPGRGLVPPDDFIPVAEETGLIVPLGEWVLRTACAQNAAWQEGGLPPVRVAVNLSARQFQQQNLLQMVAQALRETGLAPEWLELEITESTAMRDIELAVTKLTSLRDLGVHVSLDDFGTGYSSLEYLRRLPIDALKIDRSFVRDVTDDADDAAIVTALVGLAESLSLGTIAEGVETEEQLAFLREHRCQVFQGYLRSKPVPADELERMLAKGQRLKVPA
jgi:diguanylate cyclase (GGDEF)-like protein